MYRFFVLSCENKTDSRGHTGYYISTVEMKDYSVMINERKFFDRPARSNIRTYKRIIRTATVYLDNHITCCLLLICLLSCFL